MRKLERYLTCNQVMVEITGGPYANTHYDTHTVRAECCDSDPDLYGGSKQAGFFKEGVWQFKCVHCGKEGKPGITPNSAAAYWNQIAA